jgi:hypothetical protein
LIRPEDFAADRAGDKICHLQTTGIGLLIGEDDLERENRVGEIPTSTHPTEFQLQFVIFPSASTFHHDMQPTLALATSRNEAGDPLQAET